MVTIWGVSIVTGVLQNEWFIGENTLKVDDLGVPPFMETSRWLIYG